MKSKDKAKSALKARHGYDVGYGRPPEETRFQKGQTGNPRGRPKGSKNKAPVPHEEPLKSILLHEAYRMIKVRDGDRNVTVPMAQAIIRSLAVNAVKGQHRAQRLFSELVANAERQERAQNEEWRDLALTYKSEWEDELAHRAKMGITGPDPLPHPDQIVIDWRRGTADIVGPITEQEKVKYDRAMEIKRGMLNDLEDLTHELAKATTEKARIFFQDEIKRCNQVLDAVRKVIPD